MDELFCPHFWGQVVIPQIVAVWPAIQMFFHRLGV